jgi:sugar phosphate isomerase/epimerase
MTRPMERRRFVGAGLAALGLYGAGLGRIAAAGRVQFPLGPQVPFGLQLFSLDAEMHRDLPGTLRDVSAIGYREVELVGYYGLAPGALREQLQKATLQCRSIHIRPLGSPGSLPGLAQAPERHFVMARELGVRYLVCPGPWFPHSVARTLPTSSLSIADIVTAVDRMTEDDWRMSAGLINRCGEGARRHGLQLLYHNGNLEFVRSGATTGFDILFRHFDPELVKLELDCGWVMAAGHDPIRYLRTDAGRIRLAHIKDMTATPANTRMILNPAQIGEGIVDWVALLQAVRGAGVEVAYVEQEAPFTRSALEYARNNLQFLKAMR